MPEQTLLDNDENYSDDDEFDMSSFGDAVQTSELENDSPSEAEQQEKEKTMNIREKLSKRKNPSDTAPGKTQQAQKSIRHSTS